MLLAAGAAPTDGVCASCADAVVFVTSLNGVVAAKKVRTSAVPAAPALAFFFRGIVCGARKREVIFFGFVAFEKKMKGQKNDSVQERGCR